MQPEEQLVKQRIEKLDKIRRLGVNPYPYKFEQKDFSKKLVILEQLFLQKEEPARLFNSLVYQVRGNDILRLADYDVSVKSGGLEYEEALLDFVIE